MDKGDNAGDQSVDIFNLNNVRNLRFVKLIFALGRVENIVGKGENAGYQDFLLYTQCFQKATLSGSFKVGIV